MLTFRLPWHSRRGQHLISRFVRDNRLGVRKGRIANKQYLDVGCGFNVNDDFINLDYYWHPGVDICCDITRGIPLPDRSLRGIFSEHCLEHIALEKMPGVLSEFHRLLKPGGSLRLIVPDGALYVEVYRQKQAGATLEFPYQFQDPLNQLYTPMMSLNRIFYKWGHRFIYDYETLALLLEDGGFVDVRRAAFQQGRDPKLVIDADWRAHESLYVEATRPPVVHRNGVAAREQSAAG